MPLGVRPPQVTLAVIVAAVVIGGLCGYKVASWRYGEEISETRAEHLSAVAKANEKTRQIDSLNAKLTQSAAEAEALRNQKREVVERVVTKQVIKYVETDNARECGLSHDGVRLHDTAARGELPVDTDTAAKPDGEAIAATNAELIFTVVQNYNACNADLDRLSGLQDWVRSLTTTNAEF
jgi:hypothetical protein